MTVEGDWCSVKLVQRLGWYERLVFFSARDLTDDSATKGVWKLAYLFSKTPVMQCINY